MGRLAGAPPGRSGWRGLTARSFRLVGWRGGCGLEFLEAGEDFAGEEAEFGHYFAVGEGGLLEEEVDDADAAAVVVGFDLAIDGVGAADEGEAGCAADDVAAGAAGEDVFVVGGGAGAGGLDDLGDGGAEGHTGGASLVGLLLEPFLGLAVGFGQVDAAAKDELVGLGLPSGGGAPFLVFIGDGADFVDGEEGYAQAEAVAGGVADGVVAAGGDERGGEGLLHGAGPDGDGAELVVASFPGEGLGFGEGFEDKVHTFQHTGAAFGGVDAVHLVLVGGAAEESHNEASVGEVVEEGEFLGGSDGVVEGEERAEEGDFGAAAAFGDGGGHNRRGAGGDAAGVVVFGEADPVEAQFLGELAFGDAVLVALDG